MQAYASMGTPMYFRSLEKFRRLVEPWQADGRGWVSLLDWHGFDQTIINTDDQQAWGQAGGNFGAYLIK